MYILLIGQEWPNQRTIQKYNTNILKLWTLIKNIIETQSTHKFPYSILFTSLMDRGLVDGNPYGGAWD